MEWDTLLSTQRMREAKAKRISNRQICAVNLRKIITVLSAVRRFRLQDKTQVFPLDKSDFIRTRLTHSLEVASLGENPWDKISGKYFELPQRHRIYCADERGYLSHIRMCGADT